MTTTTSPATPSKAAGFWHAFAQEVGSLFQHVVTFFASPAATTAATAVMDAGLAATGSAAAVPLANAVFAGTGELLEAAAKAKGIAPSQPLTSDAIVQHLNLAQSTLATLEQVVGLGAPKIAAQVAKVTDAVQAGEVAAQSASAP